MASSVARMAAAAADWRGHRRAGGTAAVFSGAHHGGRKSFAPANLKDAIVRQQQRGDVPSTSSPSSASSARNGKAVVNEEDDRVSLATEQQPESQSLDRWAVHQAREMVTTIERQAQQAEISKMTTNPQPVPGRAPSLLREATPTNSESSTGSNPVATGGDTRPNVRASSLIQMWRELEAEAVLSPKQRTLSGCTSGESSAGNSFSVDESSTCNSYDECYAFADWSSDAVTTTSNSVSSSMNESEKSRVGSIVKMLTSGRGGPGGSMATAPSDENDATPSAKQAERWRGAAKAVLGLKPLRGRGEMESFVARMEQERQRELVAVAGRQYVSRFAYRGRIQSMLKLRSLRRQEAVQDQMRAPPPLPRGQRQKGSAISSIRERFDGGHRSSRSRNLTLDTSVDIQVQFPINNNEVPNFLMNSEREELYACSTNHFTTDTSRYQEVAPPLPCPADHMSSDTPQYRQTAPLLSCPTNQLTYDISPQYQQIAPPLSYPADHFTSNTSSPRFQHIAPPLPCATSHLISSNTSPQYQQIAPPLPYTADHLTSSNTPPQYRQIASPLPGPTDHLTSNTSPPYQPIAPPLSYPTDHFTSNTPRYQDIAPPFPSCVDHTISDTSQWREITPPHPCPTDHLTFSISQYQEITSLLPCPTNPFTHNTSQYQEILPPFPCCNDTPRYQDTATPDSPMHTQSRPNLPHPTMRIEDLQEGSQITTIGWNESNMWVGNLESLPSNEWQNEVVAEELESFPQQSMSIWAGEESSNTRRSWRVQRRPLDHDFLENFSDNVEIRELLERRRVSTSLESDFCDKMNQMLLSFLQQQQNQSNYEEEENNMDYSYWQTGADEDQNAEPTSSSLVPLHNKTYQTMQQPHSWQHHEPFSHQSSQNVPDMEVMNDMRNDMAKIREQINELRVMVESCIEWQSTLRQCIKQDILKTIQQTVGTASSSGNFGKDSARKGTCCICCEVQVDSLLYRCGHMCTCFTCAHQLKWSSGKCPICRSPIVDVVRTFSNS